MKIGLFADTHSMHGLFDYKEFKGFDMLIFAGDCSNPKAPALSAPEVLNFIEWYESIKVPIKLWIAGNHDIAIEAKLVRPKEICKTTTYLQHESIEIEGLTVFGSPYTPTFQNWAFNVARHKIGNYWNKIPPHTDILITHGPPKGICDLAYHDRVLERCGDKALLSHVLAIQPKLHVFGHIHDNDDCYNQGTFIRDGITFINASCVTDGKFGDGLTSRIKTFEI